MNFQTSYMTKLVQNEKLVNAIANTGITQPIMDRVGVTQTTALAIAAYAEKPETIATSIDYLERLMGSNGLHGQSIITEIVLSVVTRLAGKLDDAGLLTVESQLTSILDGLVAVDAISTEYIQWQNETSNTIWGEYSNAPGTRPMQSYTTPDISLAGNVSLIDQGTATQPAE